ncbi:hypothetical protein ACFX2A_044849 [Malus domestica]
MGPSTKTMKFMTIETRSVKKKTTLGKSTADLLVQSPGQEVSHVRNLLVAVTLKAASVTHREKKVYLGTQPRNTEVPNRAADIFIEGIMKDCDEDGDEGSDPQTRSFLRR